MSRPPIELSNSRLNLLESCAFTFQQRHLRPHKDPGSERSRFGRCCHAYFDADISHRVRKNRKQDWEASGLIAERVFKAGLADGLLTDDNYEEAMRIANIFSGAFTLNRKGSHYTERVLVVNKDWQPMDVEYDYDAHCVKGVSEDLISGIPDYIRISSRGDFAEIWDFKSGEEHVQAGSALGSSQGQLYTAMLMAHYPSIEKADFILWGVKYGFGNKDSASYTRAVIDDAKARTDAGFSLLDSLHLVYGEKDWPASGQSHDTCSYCPVRERCPILLANWAALGRMAA